MKKLTIFIVLATSGLTALYSQQGPAKESTETVAKPRKKDAPAEAELPKIPTKFGKKEGQIPQGPSFKSDVVSVNLEVSVMDNKGRFIPNIPQGAFRILEDNVPQTVNNFGVGEGPMTVCLVIEFSNLFQQYWDVAQQHL